MVIMKDISRPTDFCIICDKEIKSDKKLMINFDNAGGRCVGPDIKSNDSGLQYIGAECAKKFPKEWILKDE